MSCGTLLIDAAAQDRVKWLLTVKAVRVMRSSEPLGLDDMPGAGFPRARLVQSSETWTGATKGVVVLIAHNRQVIITGVVCFVFYIRRVYGVTLDSGLVTSMLQSGSALKNGTTTWCWPFSDL
jgi:hypothetical protein